MNFDQSTTIRSGMIELVRDTMTIGIVQRVLFWSHKSGYIQSVSRFSVAMELVDSYWYFEYPVAIRLTVNGRIH